MTYPVIVADPPWPYNGWVTEGVPTRKKIARGMATPHYPVMKIDQIKALPVANLAAKDCCLFMWATWPRLEAALEVGKAWGFRYVTDAFIWVKTNPTRGDSFLTKSSGWHFGLGYWTRANSEPCLLFTKGHPKRVSNSVPQLLIAPVGKHSAKPLEVFDRVEKLVGMPTAESHYLEMFARNKGRENWHYWGNEIENDIEVGA